MGHEQERRPGPPKRPEVIEARRDEGGVAHGEDLVHEEERSGIGQGGGHRDAHAHPGRVGPDRLLPGVLDPGELARFGEAQTSARVRSGRAGEARAVRSRHPTAPRRRLVPTWKRSVGSTRRSTRPTVGAIVPAAIPSSVDFPDPFRPRIATDSPEVTSRSSGASAQGRSLGRRSRRAVSPSSEPLGYCLPTPAMRTRRVIGRPVRCSRRSWPTCAGTRSRHAHRATNAETRPTTAWTGWSGIQRMP